MVGQRMLTSWYESVKFHNPDLAESIREDVRLVALYGLTDNKEPGQEAATRLRRVSFNLPAVFGRSLDGTLRELGYA